MSFLTTAIFWLLPLISIPLIFHLLKRRKFMTIPFSTLRFFKSIETESINKINIINILLLIIRTLIILFIILMISRPVLTGKYSTTKNNNNTLVMIYVDNSFSNKENINKNINSTINNIASSYNNKTFIKIVRMSDSKIIYNKINDSIISISNRLPITYSSILLNNSILNTSFQQNDLFSRKDLYILSDLNKSMFEKLSKQSIIELQDFNKIFIKRDANTENIKINSIKIDKPFLIPNELFTVKCSIDNSYKDIEELSIELFINNINVGKNIIKMNYNSKKEIMFKSSLPDFGNYPCYIKINSDDPIKDDNYFYFNLNIEDKLNIATISKEQDNYFLVKALNTFNEFYNNHQLLQYSKESYLVNNEASFNSIAIFGYNELTEELLYKAKSQTNNVILFPTSNDYEGEYVSSILKNIFLLKNNFTRLNNDSFVSIDTTGINNAYKNIFSTSNSDRSIKIFQYLELPISPETVIKQSNGTTFLYDYQYEGMTISILSSPLNLSSYNFPIKGSFLPFIKILTDRKILENYYFSNEPITYNNFHKMNHVLPNKKSYPINEDILNFNDIGIHKLTKNNDIIDYISINIHPDEHLNSSLSDNEIKDLFPDSDIIENEDSLQDFLKEMIIGIEIWMYLLYIIVFLTIIEMYLSNFHYKE